MMSTRRANRDFLIKGCILTTARLMVFQAGDGCSEKLATAARTKSIAEGPQRCNITFRDGIEIASEKKSAA